jgi:hypothetical protein
VESNPHRRTGQIGRRATLLPLVGVVALAVLAGTTYALINDGGEPVPAVAGAAVEGPGSTNPPTPSTAADGATPTPTPSPTPTRAAGPSPTPPAKARPAGGGWPGPDNTGVPAGTKLKRSGTVTVTRPGTVIDRLDVRGCILVLASNVTIRRTRVRGGPCGADHGIDIGYGETRYQGVLIEDVEVDGLNTHARGAGIGNSGFTCRRCDIHGHARGIQATGNVVVEDSWIHDLYGTANSENAPFQSNGGSHMVLRHNNFDQNDLPTAYTALALLGDFEKIDDVLVERNLFNGGGHCVYAGSVDSKPHPIATRVRFRDNAFGRKHYRRCGQHGPVAFWSAKGRGNVWSGNYWVDTRTTVPPQDS